MAVTVLVPGYGGRSRAVERWRMRIAIDTLAQHGGGELIVSGHRGEAERLAALAPQDVTVHVESLARSTLENVQRSSPWLREADVVAIATDRLVHATRRGPTSWMMTAASVAHHTVLWIRGLARRLEDR